MRDPPFFSVVMATHGRGHHITPSIESVLQQTFDNFELIVVGDGCDDATGSIVSSFLSRRITWLNLPHNSGSQSRPNNHGIETARGEWIAYLGHDDIWMPDHLKTLAAAIQANKSADVVVAGCVFYGPPGSKVYYVTGLFDAPEAARVHFFPPSSITHRRDVTARVGNWKDPNAIILPVDSDFQLRAATSGMNFISTGSITVQKFAAGHRYLSYLDVSSSEQRKMLADINNGKNPDTEAMIAAARRNGTYMVMLHPSIDESMMPGALFERNRQNKGISRPALTPLRKRTIIKQTDEGRGLDWHSLERRWHRRYRWSGPSPKPKILIPYTGERARITIVALKSNPSDLSIYIDDSHIPSRVEKSWTGISRIVAEIPLKANGYTVLTLDMPTIPYSMLDKRKDNRSVGIAVANIIVDPIKSK